MLYLLHAFFHNLLISQMGLKAFRYDVQISQNFVYGQRLNVTNF